MKTLIIPACGASRLEGPPRFLVRHPNGNRLLKHCIMGFHNYNFDKIIIAVRETDENIFQIQNIIDTEFTEFTNIVLEVLSIDTFCPAETVYYAIKNNNVIGEIIIHDADIYVDMPEISSSTFVIGTNLMELNPTITSIKDKCFLKINEQNCVLDIIEKCVKSDIICLGVYGIEDAELFISAYESLSSIPAITDHLYISHIMSYLLGMGKKIISFYNATTYESWATDGEWANLKCMFGTYLINFDELIERTNSTDYEIYYKHSARLKQLQDYGAKLVFFTTHSENKHDKIVSCLKKYNVKPHEILFDCSFNATYMINSKKDLKYQLLNIG